MHPNAITPPPEGFKPEIKKGYAWCPYCGRAFHFVWDAKLAYSRCPGCGIGATDWHTRTCNRLWDPAVKDKFDAAVKDSGRRWERGGGGDGAPEAAKNRRGRKTPPASAAPVGGEDGTAAGLFDGEDGGLPPEASGGVSSMLPKTTLEKVRALAARECVNFTAAWEDGRRNFCLVRDGACVFFGGRGNGCRWFEEGVLPLDRKLESEYWDARETARPCGLEDGGS